MFSMIFGIISGALAAMSAFGGSMAQGGSQRMQAAAMRSQAEASRRNADIALERSRAEALEQDRQKSRLRREFGNVMADNRVSLAAGNVDMSSGSAMDVANGNINNFAADLADNSYARAMRLWEGRQQHKNLNWQADVQDANASYLRRTAANMGTSLLSAGLAGAGGFAGGYTMAGGSLSNLFGSGGAAGLWDKPAAGGGLLMRHPSGKWALAPAVK